MFIDCLDEKGKPRSKESIIVVFCFLGYFAVQLVKIGPTCVCVAIVSIVHMLDIK